MKGGHGRQAAAAADDHAKDKLENKLHEMRCANKISLRTAQRGIASDWIALYKRVSGVAPH